ncbi:MAG: rod-binding protein [Litoreibacter sp.]|uniref:rod-binding protein n=1 Tax=Litoreibacter sp. TaxID=1969459 RepID=UPI003297F267
MDIQSIQSPLDRVELFPRTDAQRDVVRKLEQVFIAEMLKSIDTASGEITFAGGAGEEQFKSFLNDEYAEMIVAHGGVGLSVSIMTKMPGGHGYEK